MIDFESNIPYYVQLTSALKERIRLSRWEPGKKIPGEMDLCQEAGVSRTVVRQALRELELGGLIVRRKGKGAFVSEPKINESLVQELTGSFQDMAERGLPSSTRVLHQRVVPCTDKVARYLNVSPGTQVVDIDRLRFVGKAPIQLVNSYVPFDLCPALANVDLTNRSMYEFLEQECGLWISRGRRYLEAVAANEVEARLLEIDKGTPLVCLDSISYLENGTAIEYYHALHRGDRSRFEVELLRTRAQSQGLNSAEADIEKLPQIDANFR
jgi:GntR family transcriptional regulator